MSKPTKESVGSIKHIQRFTRNMEHLFFHTDKMQPIKELLAQTNNDCLFEVRKGNPIVYYSGGKIMDIYSKQDQTPYLKIDKKYACNKNAADTLQLFNEVHSLDILLGCKYRQAKNDNERMVE